MLLIPAIFLHFIITTKLRFNYQLCLLSGEDNQLHAILIHSEVNPHESFLPSAEKLLAIFSPPEENLLQI